MIPSFLLVILLITCQGFKLGAQYYFYNDRYYDRSIVTEIGIHSGGINCLTDLGGHPGKNRNHWKDLNWQYTKPFATLYFSGLYQQKMGIRAQLTAGQIFASDAVLKNAAVPARSRYLRNLHVRTEIWECSLIGEWHPLNFFGDPPLVSPYLLAGIGFFQFKPMARWGDRWVELQPLRTEGQGFNEYPDRKPYALKSWSVPLGLGFRYDLSAIACLRLELNYRILQTDYLDDVSKTYASPESFAKNLHPGLVETALALSNRKKEIDSRATTAIGEKRGDPAHNDSWFTAGLSIGFILNRIRK